MSSTPTTSLNQIDVTQVKAFVDRVSAVPELADRERTSSRDGSASRAPRSPLMRPACTSAATAS